jgi:hypothetical protein
LEAGKAATFALSGNNKGFRLAVMPPSISSGQAASGNMIIPKKRISPNLGTGYDFGT